LLALTCGCQLESTHVFVPPKGPLGRIQVQVPDSVDPESRYVFYLHGRIIEEQGVRPIHPKFGVYEYQQILEALAGFGLQVISEARPSGSRVEAYADKLAGQVEQLMAAGVSPERITVIGFSKGGIIAALASSRLANPKLNFVLMACCGPWLEQQPGIDLSGRVLSFYEASDELGGSCVKLVAQSDRPVTHHEIRLELGGGHGAFYRLHPEWLMPTVDWIHGADASPEEPQYETREQ
jgi:predicted esterase